MSDPALGLNIASERIKKVRNLGIIAHIDAGKTTTTERILYYSGTIHRMGNVDDGNTTTDWMVQEKERGITITSAVISSKWKDCTINLIDTPGHVDFTVEVERALRILDGAVVIFCSVGGVQPQSETVWRQADKYKVPRIVYINKMDRTGADFFKVLNEIKEKLGAKPVALQLPIGSESNFRGVIDLVNMHCIVFNEHETKGTLPVSVFSEEPIPQDLIETAQLYRNILLEALADIDDQLMEKYLSGDIITVEEIKKALVLGCHQNIFFPVACGSSFKNKGTQQLLDAIVDYLPSPVDVPPIQGTHPSTAKEQVRQSSTDEPLSALVFKIAADPFIGSLAFTRVYSGVLKTGSYVYNATNNSNERISRIIRLHSNQREDISELRAGDIAGLVGVKKSTTGDTLCDKDHPIILEKITFPEPVVSMIVEPKTKADQDKMIASLEKFTMEDPTFKFKFDTETDQTVISGMGELHLDIIVDRLMREYNVNVNLGNPDVAYKETILAEASGEGKHIKQSGGHGQYGHVILEVFPLDGPLDRSKQFVFENAIKQGVIPKDYIPAIETGVRYALENGVVANYEVINVGVRVIDGSYHNVDSSEIAFRLAAAKAFKIAMEKASPILLEPVMKVEVYVPESYLGDCISLISSKRGRIVKMDSVGIIQIVNALVPLKHMFGFATELRSVTQGRGSYTMEFDTYERVPDNILQTIKGGK